jgi:myo-inositol 2-dehydrogenase/D-chiro-inositol 1-dehydrogenase
MVSIGVIGLGFMGSKWARAIAEHPAARLSVVSDVREDVGRRYAESWGASYVGDPLEAAAHPAVDGVVIATPEDAHQMVALAALGAAKALAVEKPLAHTVEAAEQIRNRAAELDVPVLVGHILRFEPRYAAIHRSIESGEIGAVQAIRSERIGLVTDQDILRGRTSIALYYGVHEFDLARWYAGDVARIYAERSSGILAARGFAIEDLYSATLGFAGGAHGTAMVGWSLPPATPGWGIAGFTVIGEEAVLKVVQGEMGFTKVTRNGLAHEDVTYAPEVDGRVFGPLAIEVDHFVRCVQGSSTPRCTATDGLEAVRVSLAMVTSAETGSRVDLGNPTDRRLTRQ